MISMFFGAATNSATEASSREATLRAVPSRRIAASTTKNGCPACDGCEDKSFCGSRRKPERKEREKVKHWQSRDAGSGYGRAYSVRYEREEEEEEEGEEEEEEIMTGEEEG
ncbi:unnamed protein product [Prorocentrum cordatum]|uniref:Uncharacterized protein n=1 Tax=Prorocentrum cordatum TaxID=2364126 RepID=A0ABN9RY07_9DINO|nr:unnamed protein product [Polarella glacialis]